MDPNDRYANAGVPVDKPAPQQPQQQPQQPQQPMMYAAGPAAGQPAQVDQYGRPIVTAVPTQMTPPAPHLVENNSNIRRDAAGNALCNKCNTPCRNCHELNNASVYGDECGWCTIL